MDWLKFNCEEVIGESNGLVYKMSGRVYLLDIEEKYTCASFDVLVTFTTCLSSTIISCPDIAALHLRMKLTIKLAYHS